MRLGTRGGDRLRVLEGVRAGNGSRPRSLPHPLGGGLTGPEHGHTDMVGHIIDWSLKPGTRAHRSAILLVFGGWAASRMAVDVFPT